MSLPDSSEMDGFSSMCVEAIISSNTLKGQIA